MMDIQFVDNRKKSHENYVLNILNSQDSIFILVAFLKESGLKEFEGNIKDIVKSGKSLTILVGLDFFITDPNALKTLYQIMGKENNAKLYLMQGFKDTFHPKIYCGVTGDQASFLVGSANMTSGGMKSNFEASSYFSVSTSSEYYIDFSEYLSSLVSNQNNQEANLLLIDQYKKNYEIFNQKKTKAESEAKKEIKKQFQLDVNKLSKMLDLYNEDKEETSNLDKKTSNYRKARKVLKKLSTGNITRKDEFIELYDQLVGSKGQSSLWHSGGLLRQKSRISTHYQRFIKMIREMEQNIGESPEKLFSIGMSHAKNINGLGVNVITEIMNTYSPKKYSVLNKNPLNSLQYLGFSKFKGQGSFKAKDYQEYNALIAEFARLCKFDDLSQVDHFLNYIYQNHVKNSPVGLNKPV